jgi:hypothetical protein
MHAAKNASVRVCCESFPENKFLETNKILNSKCHLLSITPYFSVKSCPPHGAQEKVIGG